MVSELTTRKQLKDLPARAIIATKDSVLERVALQKTRTGRWIGVGSEHQVNLSDFPDEAFPVLLLWVPEKSDFECLRQAQIEQNRNKDDDE